MADSKNQNQPRGTQWSGFEPDQTPQPDIEGAFRAYVDGTNIRVIDGRFGKQFSIPMRVSLGRDGEITTTYFAPYHYRLNGKFISLLKAINGIASDLPADYKLSQLATSGDVLATVITNEAGYIEVKSVSILPRMANGAPLELSPGEQQREITLPDGSVAVRFPNGRWYDKTSGELIDFEGMVDQDNVPYNPPF